MKQSKSIITFILILIFFLTPINQLTYAENISFMDVPKGHWAEADINQLRALHITDGIGNNQFGLGKTITRAEFVTFLVRTLSWEVIKPSKGSFTDNQNVTTWYFPYLETAFLNGALSKEQTFRPQAAITREEMAIMMVRALDYEDLALQFNRQKSAFSDVTRFIGYTNLLKDFGIVKGSGNNLYKPTATATREEAAAILVRMYNKLKDGMNNLHAFYSSGAYSQKDMISGLSSISFDWLTLKTDENKVELKLSLPFGYEEPLKMAQAQGIPTHLMLLVDNNQSFTLKDGTTQAILEYILRNEDVHQKLIENIVTYLNGSVPFDGITIDFESMKDESMAPLFNSFLTQLKEALNPTGKKIVVTVHPKTYYDGYDYKVIGEIADAVILMAHDYEVKTLSTSEMERGFTNTPLTPITQVYEALKAITDPLTGVQNKAKIYLQISFSSAQWQLKDKQVINASPFNPTYAMIEQRLVQENVKIYYDPLVQNPYATYFNATTNTDNKIWYEDSRSVLAKIDLAQMFGIHSISLWRLGNIPDYPEDSSLYLNVWDIIQSKI